MTLRDEGSTPRVADEGVRAPVPDDAAPRHDAGGVLVHAGIVEGHDADRGRRHLDHGPARAAADGGGAIAALRYVLTRTSSSGQLYQPRLRGDDIHLEFRDRLRGCIRRRSLEVLRAMPVEADDTRRLARSAQFGACRSSAHRSRLDDARGRRVPRRFWRTHWNDVEELLKECQRKRSMFFLNELTAYALHRIAFALPLRGYLDSRLDESAVDVQRRQRGPAQARERRSRSA